MFVFQGETIFFRDQLSFAKKLYNKIKVIVVQSSGVFAEEVGELSSYSTVVSRCKLNNWTPLFCFKITKKLIE